MVPSQSAVYGFRTLSVSVTRRGAYGSPNRAINVTLREVRALRSGPVVRRLGGDRDVVRVALSQAGRGDPNELGPVQVGDRGGAAVAHRLPEPADELVEDAAQRTLVGDTPLDALRHQLLGVDDVALEVAVLGERAGLHRPERAHAPVLLEPLA